MDRYNCWHLRIRGNKDYDENLKKYVENIENLYKKQIRALPQWNQLKQKIDCRTSTCKNKVFEAKKRKAYIINKIYVQWTRPTPFELTDCLFRTSDKWQAHVYKKPKYPSIENIEKESSIVETEQNTSELSDVAHPNTETVASLDIIEPKFRNVNTDEPVSELTSPVHRPIYIETNQHKLISPLTSKDNFVCIESKFNREKKLPDKPECPELKLTTLIKCSPRKICIRCRTLEEQTASFSLINCGSETTMIRFHSITNRCWFKKIIIEPQIPMRLYPGIAVKYKLMFKLLQIDQDFDTNLNFRVNNNDYVKPQIEALNIRIVSAFKQKSRISVTEIVQIQPVYLWQIKFGYPKSFLHVRIEDCNKYILRITKRTVNFVKDLNGLSTSLEGIPPNTESLNNIEDLQEFSKNECLEDPLEETNRDIVDDILNLVIDQALDIFVFDRTFITLDPKSNQTIPIYFTKAEHIGKHQCYYDLHFYDQQEEVIFLTKTIKIFGEVLRHPLHIYPTLLDMTQSHQMHGFYEDKIVVANTHTVYPVLVKIKLTDIMKNMIQIRPMSTLIPTTSNVTLRVRLCSKDLCTSEGYDDFVHFTIKIIITGDKSIYDKVPPIFYEIIAPCASYFEKINNRKYLNEEQFKSTVEG
uniref:Uncharacterized protein n=1 Tax=Bombyx mori TaxID=7091 RepID=A0A8R2DNX7_BOMMO|nr:uncharacterized protein LOC110386456 [Bombyx mori]